MLLCADHRDRNIGAIMKTFSTVAMSMFAGAILGASAIEGIHAQSNAAEFQCLLLRVKRTSGGRSSMSVIDPMRRLATR
jgi:hypothetical protein